MQENYTPLAAKTADAKVLRRVDDWKRRLIDLSKKNKLLYFKRSKRGNLSITSPDAESVFKKLVKTSAQRQRKACLELSSITFYKQRQPLANVDVLNIQTKVPIHFENDGESNLKFKSHPPAPSC